MFSVICSLLSGVGVGFTNPPSKPPAVGLATSLHLKGGALVKLFFYYMYLNTLIRYALKGF